jgi:DNA-binding transcriptional MocR family regulator
MDKRYVDSGARNTVERIAYVAAEQIKYQESEHGSSLQHIRQDIRSLERSVATEQLKMEYAEIQRTAELKAGYVPELLFNETSAGQVHLQAMMDIGSAIMDEFCINNLLNPDHIGYIALVSNITIY